MNREVDDLVLVFSSAFVGATIMFLAALVTFTFHHEIQERLILRGLIVPTNEPQPTNTAAWTRQEPGQPNENEEGRQRRPPFLLVAAHRNVPGLPVDRLPPIQDNPNRHIQFEQLPAAFTYQHNPWAEPPDARPQRLPNDGMIGDPHPQYILDWDQPVAMDEQPVDVPP